MIDASVKELAPWLKKQTRDLTYAVYDYANGRSQSLDLKIPLDAVRDTLRKNMRQAILQAPEVARLPVAQTDALVDGVVEQLTQQMPATLDLTRSLGPGFQRTLDNVRQGIGYFSLVYFGLIFLMVLLAAGIILLIGNARDASRNLGVTLLSFGALEYLGIVVGNYLGGAQLSSFGGLPSALQVWLPQFLDKLAAPLQMFSIVVGIIGLLLIVASFIIPRRRPVPSAG